MTGGSSFYYPSSGGSSHRPNMLEHGHQLIDPGGRKQPIRPGMVKVDEGRLVE